MQNTLVKILISYFILSISYYFLGCGWVWGWCVCGVGWVDGWGGWMGGGWGGWMGGGVVIHLDIQG